MDMRVRAVSAVCALVCGLGPLLLSTCSDHGTEPEPVKPKDYAVFFGDYSGTGGKLFRYRVVSGQLDSADAPAGLQAPRCVSADGKRLYWNSGVVVDAETFEILPSLPYRGYVAVSPDNQLVAICDTDLFIMKASDYSLVFHDTDAVTGATFSTNSKRFFAKKAAEGNCYPLYWLDLEKGNQVTRRCVAGGMGSEPLVVSYDETKLYLYKYYMNFLYSFNVYDLQLDSTVFSEPLTPGSGTLAQTPDGKDVYFTNPGGMLTGPPIPYSLAVYHSATGNIDTLMFWGKTCFSDSEFYALNQVVITPDGRWLVGTNWPHIGMITRHSLVNADSSGNLCVGNKWLKFPRIQNGL